ncbi:putative transcription factor C2H2 family [Lupinus albus]|uniref:Putative transcription factor C2H2 family n=1 Tax=Lupinus albus TaxID=3870 RepID=A0A6A4PJP6_LUPAL|nr:putative transcription factor C2H2 family [Lupinus albus]
MGKRKRISDHNQSQSDHLPSPSAEAIQCSSNMELLSDENPSHSANPGALALPRVLDLTDGSMKLVSTHPTMGHHHQSLGRSIFLKRSRHYYGHQYSQRNPANHAYASSSRGKGTSSYDDSRLSFKLASQPNSQSKQHTEYREKTFSRPERIRSNSIGMDAVSLDVVKMVCGICQKPLRRKFNFLSSSMTHCELSVVAVLVCGHVYHADCLEQRTSLEEQCDPPCPMCAGLLLQARDSQGHE